MTYNGFQLYYSAPEHGGYSEVQLRDKWSEICKAAGSPCDHRGVVKGVCGHARYRVELEDADDSVSEEETTTTRAHDQTSKQMDSIALEDILDFLEGTAELDPPPG